MKLCLIFLALISFSFFDNVKAISLNGYNVDDSIIQACNDLDYNYHFIFQEKGYNNYYVFTCSYYPVTFQNNGGTWGKNFYYHTIYDDTGNFIIQNDGIGEIHYDNHYLAYQNGKQSTTTTRHKGLYSGTTVYYSNHKIFNYVGTSSNATLYYDCNSNSCISNTSALKPTYTYDNNFDTSITRLYSIQYITDYDIIDNLVISFKYEGENEPEFNGITTYGLKNYNGLYNWSYGLGYCSDYCGLSYGDYTETYEDNIYTLTLNDLHVEDLNNEYEKLIINFEFLWANYISDINIKSNYLGYSNFNFNSFDYDYIIDNFNSSEFSYLNFSTTLEEYRNNIYFIGTANSEYSNLVSVDYYSTKNHKFSDYGAIFDVYNNELYGYDILKYFTFNIGTSSSTGFWITRNLVKDMESGNHFNFSIAYKMNKNLYFSYNQDYENFGAIITDSIDENGNPNVTITDIAISDDVFTPEDYKDFFTITSEFLNNLKDTRNSINDLYNHFYDSLPTLLKGLHNFILIILCLIIFIKVGVEQ